MYGSESQWHTAHQCNWRHLDMKGQYCKVFQLKFVVRYILKHSIILKMIGFYGNFLAFKTHSIYVITVHVKLDLHSILKGIISDLKWFFICCKTPTKSLAECPIPVFLSLFLLQKIPQAGQLLLPRTSFCHLRCLLSS